jgi:hypothetical protein
MRAEDRQPSKRVFPLLQNLDLDTVTFAEVQSVGDPISIQDMNEQEMVDLIIVNLARLCVAGEWSGLLEAGGGTFNAVLPTSVGTSTRYQLAMATPFGNTGQTSNTGFTDFSQPRAYPFVAAESGDVSEIGIKVAASTASADALVGIYSTSDGKPDALLGYADIELSSTGEIFQTSLSATITLVAGTNYFYCIGEDASASGGTLTGVNGDYVTPLGVSYEVATYQTCYRHDTAVTALPATFVADATRQTGRVLVTVKVG